ncbi:hypothetical protein Pmani_027696, partial [Petrolisthes manimaculis]
MEQKEMMEVGEVQEEHK